MHASNMLLPDPLVGEPVARSASSTTWAGAQQQTPTLVHTVRILLVKIEDLSCGKSGSPDGASFHLALQRTEMSLDKLARREVSTFLLGRQAGET